MNIHEFQTKKLLKSAGLRIPKGDVARTPDQAREIASWLKGSAWMVKAQIRAGGRKPGTIGDAGSGVRKAYDLDQVRRYADAMINRPLITRQTDAAGLLVESVYIEQALEVDKEIGLGLLVDERGKQVMLLLAEQGGTEIETIAENNPQSIHRFRVDINSGVVGAKLDQVLSGFELTEALKSDLRITIDRTSRLFCSKDAALIEINPLGLCAGKWVALDARMAFDRNAFFRQEAILAMKNEGDPEDSQKQASVDGFNYLAMDGDVGCMAVGAGLSMATLDAIRQYGGKPANFMDLPPDSKVNRVVGALELLLSNPGIKSLIINVFGGGIMRCDTISDAITLVHNSTAITIPLSVRLAGTNAELANRRLKETMPQVFLASSLMDAAQYALDSTNAQASPGTTAAGYYASWTSRLRSVFKSRT